ncbi:hypothetical protein [Treponema primitia]|uniref:hypothetical protein n=1 Tax=Treponema primitia TaxID=88058 RepID=UPI0002555160|nr:hypothetical protein [Treponema primitia]
MPYQASLQGIENFGVGEESPEYYTRFFLYKTNTVVVNSIFNNSDNLHFYKDIANTKKKSLRAGNVFQKEIHKRFKFLDRSLEDDQDEEIYKLTKTITLEVLQYLSFDIPPFIGIDNSGQVIVEWHNYKECRIVRIIPVIQEKIIFQGIKTNSMSFTVTSTLQNIKEQGSKDLTSFIPG